MKQVKDKKAIKRLRIRKKIRSKVFGTGKIPRLAVFRSSHFLYAQLIDDGAGKTLLSASDRELKGTKSERAKAAGGKLAEAAKAKKISKVVFDRGGFSYAGRIKSFADGAR